MEVNRWNDQEARQIGLEYMIRSMEKTSPFEPNKLI
jgi:hypothetical protein